MGSEPKRMENTGECWARFGALQRASMRKWFIGGYAWEYDGGKKEKDLEILRAKRFLV